MEENVFLRLKTWFDGHISPFYRNDPKYDAPLRLKAAHTQRVRGLTRVIGREMGLDEPSLRLAVSIAMFHDIGRFAQYERYRTFNDIISKNHAVMGLGRMARGRALAGVERREKKIICRSIFYHNAARLPRMDEVSFFFARLIRDADKLDILGIFADYYPKRDQNPDSVIELGLPDGPGISREAVSALLEGRSALKSHVKTLTDFKLLQISWVFDLNFPHSFALLERFGHIEKIAAGLPETREIKAAMTHVRRRVRRRAAERALFSNPVSNPGAHAPGPGLFFEKGQENKAEQAGQHGSGGQGKGAA
ncbi:conserved hypothetical protein [Candidatus Desulfarcum epimagneticum]|uniref:HD domain-containing protein n=1 Tax=uncultured Desulfobacteraceae bacterium TaxID=218296 RepID=A0A484HDT6_9BACT|nr:conserved hypothetical protein [uncultured Desulfobacteraceae bacterium]